ncbi:uncharacterized protein LAESUDRAFT_643447, partial [Laetiporus sulphureus 93-53]
MTALLDSGAFSCYIDQRFAEKHGFKMIPLKHEIQILNTDASPNKGDAITHLTDIGKLDMIIGMSYLCQHNSEINWQAGEWKYSRCPSTC